MNRSDNDDFDMQTSTLTQLLPLFNSISPRDIGSNWISLARPSAATVVRVAATLNAACADQDAAKSIRKRLISGREQRQSGRANPIGRPSGDAWADGSCRATTFAANKPASQRYGSIFS